MSESIIQTLLELWQARCSGTSQGSCSSAPNLGEDEEKNIDMLIFLSCVGMEISVHTAQHYRASMCQLSLASEHVGDTAQLLHEDVWELKILN